MSEALILFIDREGSVRDWRRIDGERGLGDTSPVLLPGERLIAVVPADTVTLHWAQLPGHSLAQATAAARLLVAEVTTMPASDLHVAVGDESSSELRPIAAVSRAQMARWLVALPGQGWEPDALVPAPLLLPRPESGFVQAALGGQMMVRGPGSAFADEPGLTELLTGGELPVPVSPEAMDRALLEATRTPPLNLRQGTFARRRQRQIDWLLVKRLGWLALAFLTLTLIISIVRIAKYEFAADALESRADLLARSGIPRGETVTDADRQLSQRLQQLRGGGAGFGNTAAVVFAAARAVPGTRVSALAFDASGKLRVTVSTAGDGQAADFQRRIEARGFTVTPGALISNAGRVSGQLTVSGR